MKILFLLLALCLFHGHFLMAQEEPAPPPQRLALTIGFRQGGGSLVGMDLELMIGNDIGLQAGLGVRGYGAALLYHPNGGIRSSMLAFTYWHQGLGDYFVQEVIGASYVYRGKKWFTAQLGLGRPLREDPFLPRKPDQPGIMLLYSIGFYLAA